MPERAAPSQASAWLRTNGVDTNGAAPAKVMHTYVNMIDIAGLNMYVCAKAREGLEDTCIHS